MPRNQFKLTASDQTALQVESRVPDGSVKSVVCLVHGLGEHCSRYEHLAEACTHHHHAYTAFDLRGHGRSAGRRGHAPNYATLMADLDAVLNHTESLHPGRPLFLYGHSLGGNLVLHYALTHPQRPLAGVIASAPLLRLSFTPPRWKTALLHLLNILHLQISLPNGLDDNALSRDLNVIRAYRNDPLTHGEITPRLAVEMIRKGVWNLKHAAAFPCPLLLMHGEADQITSHKASTEFAKQGQPNCTLKLWKNLYHELHNEPEQTQVIDYALHWINQKANESPANT